VPTIPQEPDVTHSLRKRLAASACTLLCLLANTASAGTLQGTAAYRERIALPPDAVFEATLQDVARADAPATVIGRAKLQPAGQPPFRFEIKYDDAAIKSNGRYAVRATITQGGQLLFTTDRVYSVLDGRNAPLDLLLVSANRGAPTKGKPEPLGALPASFEGELPGAGNPIRWHVDLFKDGRYQLRMTHVGRPEPNQFDDIGRWNRERESGRIVLRGGREGPVYLLPVDGGAALRKLDLKGKPIQSEHNDRLERQPKFAPIEPRLMLTGMFVYFADSANINVCIDGRSVPVSMEADFKALQAAYMKTRKEPMERVLVSVDGRFAMRPSMEPGQPPRTNLIVERFVNAWPDQQCGGKPKL
jgi:copper homeostasis protein (lipoprotein)